MCATGLQTSDVIRLPRSMALALLFSRFGSTSWMAFTVTLPCSSMKNCRMTPNSFLLTWQRRPFTALALGVHRHVALGLVNLPALDEEMRKVGLDLGHVAVGHRLGALAHRAFQHAAIAKMNVRVNDALDANRLRGGVGHEKSSLLVTEPTDS